MKNQNKIFSLSNLKDVTIHEILTDPPLVALIVTNLVIVVNSFLGNVNLFNILWLYWIQSVIIGLFNALNILTARKYSTEGVESNFKLTKISITLFFCFHYGLFHLVYAVFLSVFSSMNGHFAPTDFSVLKYGAIAFFMNYLFEFVYLKFKRTDFVKTVNLANLMLTPYKRIIPMHLSIMVMGFMVAFNGPELTARSGFITTFFVSLKTIIDVFTHLHHHREDSLDRLKNNPKL